MLVRAGTEDSYSAESLTGQFRGVRFFVLISSATAQADTSLRTASDTT